MATKLLPRRGRTNDAPSPCGEGLAGGESKKLLPGKIYPPHPLPTGGDGKHAPPVNDKYGAKSSRAGQDCVRYRSCRREARRSEPFAGQACGEDQAVCAVERAGLKLAREQPIRLVGTGQP